MKPVRRWMDEQVNYQVIHVKDDVDNHRVLSQPKSYQVKHCIPTVKEHKKREHAHDKRFFSFLSYYYFVASKGKKGKVHDTHPTRQDVDEWDLETPLQFVLGIFNSSCRLVRERPRHGLSKKKIKNKKRIKTGRPPLFKKFPSSFWADFLMP